MSDHPSNIERGPSGSVVVPLHRAAPPSCEGVGLASLMGHALAGRFCAWHGLSGRRYVASVHPLDRAAPDLGLPDYEACILIAVGGAPSARRILDIVAVERAADRRGLLARAAAAGEWHVHLLAEDRRARAAVLDDLRARHCPAEIAARCA